MVECTYADLAADLAADLDTEEGRDRYLMATLAVGAHHRRGLRLRGRRQPHRAVARTTAAKGPDFVPTSFEIVD